MHGQGYDAPAHQGYDAQAHPGYDAQAPGPGYDAAASWALAKVCFNRVIKIHGEIQNK